MIIADAPTTDQLRGKLAEHARTNSPASDYPFPKEYLGVYKERRLECALQLYKAVGVERGDRDASARQTAKNFEFFGAPHFALVTASRGLGLYAAVDCGAFVSNFMLAAASIGVASIAQAALAAHSGFFRDALAIPDDRVILCGISFGYPDRGDPANGFRTTRAEVSEITRWIGFGNRP